MIISHIKQFIFIHNKKTGGSSIKSKLRNFDSKDPLDNSSLFQFHSLINSTKFPKHISAHELKNELPDEVFSNYFKFVFVRNPWDLQVSSYFYYLQRPLHPLHEIVNKYSFPEYIEWGTSGEFSLQKSLCCDLSGSLLVNFVGHYENLQHDFDAICQTLNIADTKLPHFNTSIHQNYRYYYDKLTMNMIKEFYQPDLDLWNYRF